MLVNILTNFAAVFIGGLITWRVSRYFYQKAGQELIAEAAGLRRLTEITLHVMEDAGMVRLNRDGLQIIGRVVDTRKPLLPGGAIVDKGDIIQYKDKYVEILRHDDARLRKKDKSLQATKKAGPAVTGIIERGPMVVKPR